MFRPTAYQVAVLLVAVTQRAGERRANASRWKFSGLTIRKVGRRKRLRRQFLEDLSYELEELGFVLIELPSGSFGLISMDAIEGWTRLSARDRLGTEFDILASEGPEAFARAIEELAIGIAQAGASGEEDD